MIKHLDRKDYLKEYNKIIKKTERNKKLREQRSPEKIQQDTKKIQNLKKS